MLHRLTRAVGTWIARYLEQPAREYQPFSATDADTLEAALRPADILLVEGNQRISVAVKYITQSTWSHAAIYVGNPPGTNIDDSCGALVEADLTQGVTLQPITKYAGFNVRICRPVGLSETDRATVINFVLERVGLRYDLKNVFDLARYLLPRPPLPARWRRRLRLGSGDPTQAICSTLIAQAFQAIQYPILPESTTLAISRTPGKPPANQKIMRARSYARFTPRDFDLSPYFEVVKPTLAQGFDYNQIVWETPRDEEAGEGPPRP